LKPGTYKLTRREMIGAGIGVGASILSGCWKVSPVDAPVVDPSDPFITARVTAPTGTTSLGLTVPLSTLTAEAFLYVPTGYQASTPAPLVLMLHGEGQTAFNAISLFQPHADAAGLVLLSVDSVGRTWDIFALDIYGPDLTFMNDALTAAFKIVNVDPARIAVEGFSDGASYALTLGRTNGDFFSHVISFSATLVPRNSPSGKPKFFLSHGLSDPATITQIGDVLDAELLADGYDVDYVRFDGVHEVPDSVVQQAIAWLAT
jgi:phospholipase/carboxylesterase